MSSPSTFRVARFGPPGVTTQSNGIPAAAYPGRIASNADLIVAVDRQQTNLLVPLAATDLTMTVLSPTLMAAYSLLSIDNEIVQATGPATGNIIPISRGFDGTTPAAHLANAPVLGLVDAYHHNALVAEIEAIETALGPNLSRIPASGAYVISSSFVFPPQTPGGNLNVGNNVINISPVPQGVNGSDQKHYLYVSSGTGTPEAVLITGGTAVSGAASGTLFINCANTHSGAWTIQTATSGIQEAVNAAPIGAVVFIPPGTWPTYAPVSIINKVQILGAGLVSSIVEPQSLTQDVFDVVTPNPGGSEIPVIFRDFMILSLSTQTSGNMISITAASGYGNQNSEISHVWFEGYATAVNLLNCGYFTVAECDFHSSASTNTALLLANPANVDFGDSIIQRNWFYGGGTSINYQSGAGLRIFDNKFLANQTGINLNWTGGGGNQVSIHSNHFDSIVANAIILSCDSSSILTDWSVLGNFFGNVISGSYIKIQGAGTIVRGLIASNRFMLSGSGSGTCINILAGDGIGITGNDIVTSASSQTVISAASGTNGSFIGNMISSYANLGYSVASSGFYFAHNYGIDTVMGQPVSAATFTLPLQPNFVLQGGSGTITTIIPPTNCPGLCGTFIPVSVLTFAVGPTIGQAGTTTPNKLYYWLWDGSKLWITGPGF